MRVSNAKYPRATARCASLFSVIVLLNSNHMLTRLNELNELNGISVLIAFFADVLARKPARHPLAKSLNPAHIATS